MARRDFLSYGVVRLVLGPLLAALLCVSSLAASAALSVDSAVAAGVTVSDATGDAPDEVDLQRVRISHGTRAIRLTLDVADVQIERGGFFVYIDTPGPGKPDYMVGIDGHYLFGETKGWHLVANGTDPFGNINCSNGGRANTSREVVSFRFPRSCIGSPLKVRVAVESALYVGGPPDYAAEFERDFAGNRHSFSDWVPAG